MNTQLIDRSPPTERAGIVIPWTDPKDRPSEDRLIETSGLAEALGCALGFVRAEQIRTPNPSQLLSTGMLDRLAEDLADEECTLAVIDGALTPIQQRNLERRLGVKVIDRTGLILEIFGLRARTKEGVLQVELARQLYERSRLVRTWTHLERQRGGRGFLSGPGETQLEADKRMLDTRVKRLRADLEAVRRTRGLQRQGRRRAGVAVIALVGYTNAGKSTLFNRLSGADVLAKDMPFATLDPTIRRVRIPAIGEAALVDTVGFITDLPTHLIDAFQATLEEAMEADLIVHVRDRSSPVDASQKADVEQVLERLQAEMDAPPPLIEAWNKVDRLDPDTRALLAAAARRADPPAALVSATTGEGFADLVHLITGSLRSAEQELRIRIEHSDGAARAWLYDRAEIIGEATDATGVTLVSARLAADQIGRFLALFPDVRIDSDS